jgi:hypothetical protein
MSTRAYVATRKGLFTIDRKDAGWQITRGAFVGDNVSLVTHDPRDGAVYAVLDHGHFGIKLHKSTNGGDSFEEIAAPVYPEKPEGVSDKDGWGTELDWSLKQIWALNEPLWNHDKRNLWMGGGADFPGIHSIVMDPRNPDCVTVGVSCGGVWITEDDGASWNCRAEGMRAEFMPPERVNEPYIQDVHCVVRCAGDPDKLWTQHHCGIFRTVDNCASWQEIEKAGPSTFGFPVAVHPTDGDTAWFIPGIKDEKRIPVDGKVVVTRTRDGGASFDVLREGLPQHHAYDLVYRHALDIDESGERLAFGSTTGNVWVTENGGDAWSQVSAHLPPVYCVRFAS